KDQRRKKNKKYERRKILNKIMSSSRSPSQDKMKEGNRSPLTKSISAKSQEALHPNNQTGFPKVAKVVLLLCFCERFSYYGIIVVVNNFMVYQGFQAEEVRSIFYSLQICAY